jgi:hypothetical protein
MIPPLTHLPLPTDLARLPDLRDLLAGVFRKNVALGIHAIIEYDVYVIFTKFPLLSSFNGKIRVHVSNNPGLIFLAMVFWLVVV